jgi:hypothetical protein
MAHKLKTLLLAVFVGASTICNAQQRIKNVIVVVTDGFRWQEFFNGADRQLATSKKFSQGDSAAMLKKYWDSDSKISRTKVLPFIWGTIAKKGQIYGNRNTGNLMNTANPYWFSYPGYNEILTGYPDIAVNSNDYKANPNVTVLEYLNKQPAFKGKVAAYASWDAFDRIFNKERARFPVVAAFENTGGAHPTTKEKLLNTMLANSYRPFNDDECLDVFTHYEAMEYLKEHKPRVMFIGYGETDEWAHAGKYYSYLNAAHQVDKWLSDLWGYIQSDPNYKDQTALVITTDHGRGLGDEWTTHGAKVKGASEMWVAIMGPGIAAKGEVTAPMQNYQQQIAQTVASLLGTKFIAEHPVADKLDLK